MSLEEVNGNFTEGQKNEIYRKMLVPLKLKISQILLYDTESALKFLQQYNEIVKNEKIIGDGIVQKIVDLEFQMQNYLNADGKEKMYEEQSNTLVQQIEDLEVQFKQLSLEDFEQQLEEIKKVYYTNSTNYTFENRDFIERRINSLQANLIMQKVNSGTIYDVKEMISKDNKEGLTMYIYDELSVLMENKNIIVQNLANQLKTIIANEDDFLSNSRTWKLLDSAQRHTIKTNQKQIENRMNLPAVQKKKTSFPLLDIISGNRIFVGDKQMNVEKTVQLGEEEVRTTELSKIDMNWLSSKVSRQMLEEIELRRLNKEGKNAVERYVPDAKTPIYDFMSVERNFNDNIGFFNEEGIKASLMIIRKGKRYEVKIHGDDDSELTNYHVNLFIIININNVMEYAKFIDSIIGSNLSQKFANEIGVFFEKKATSKKIVYDREKRLPIYRNLLKSYQKIEQEYEETKISFRGQENIKRETFYQQNNLRNSIRIVDNNQSRDGKKGKKEINISEEEIEQE